MLGADGVCLSAFGHMLSEKVDVFWTSQQRQPLTQRAVIPRTDSSGGLEWTTDDAKAMTLGLGWEAPELVASFLPRSCAMTGAIDNEILGRNVRRGGEGNERNHGNERSSSGGIVKRRHEPWVPSTRACP